MKKFLSDVLIECGLQVSGTTALGTATAATVATSDNSTNIATTAWVKSLGYTGYTSWNLKTNSVQRTTVQSGGDLDLIAGTDISISYGAGGKVTIASTATGSVDYISDVVLNGSALEFTGVGTAFTGSIDLSGLILDLPNLTAGKIWVGSANDPIESTTVHIDEANGRLGIGTTSPTYKLDVETADDIVASFVSTDNKASINIKDNDTSVYISAENAKASFGFNIGIHANNLNVDSSGNVGIGTTSPDSKLEVSDAGSTQIKVTNTTDSVETVVLSQSSGGWIGTQTSHPLKFGTGYGAKMIIDTNGNLGIGHTSPTYRVHAKTDSTTWGYRFENNTGDQDTHVFMSHGGGYGLAVDTTDNRSSTYLLSLKGGTGGAGLGTVERFRVASDGNIYLNTYLFAYEDISYTRLYRPNGSAGIYLGGSGDPANYYDNDYHYFRTSGAVANLGVWNSTGLGIGTTSPTRTLSVEGTAFVRDDFAVTVTNPGTNLRKDSQIYLQSKGNQSGTTRSSQWYLQTESDSIYGNSGFSISKNYDGGSTNEYLRITSSGNVGIGTTTPVEKLHVVGNVQIEGGSTSVVLETNNKGADPAGALFGEYDIATTYGAIVDYVIYDAGRDNMRSGTFSAVWNAAETRYNDVSTVDIGDTSVVTLTSQINGANVELIVTGDAVYTIKFNVKLIK
jgi:hypothetical protein